MLTLVGACAGTDAGGPPLGGAFDDGGDQASGGLAEDDGGDTWSWGSDGAMDDGPDPSGPDPTGADGTGADPTGADPSTSGGAETDDDDDEEESDEGGEEPGTTGEEESTGEPPMDDPQTITISGIVTHGLVEPGGLGGVTVELWGDPGIFDITAGDGSFVLEDIPLGSTVEILADAPGYLGGVRAVQANDDIVGFDLAIYDTALVPALQWTFHNLDADLGWLVVAADQFAASVTATRLGANLAVPDQYFTYGEGGSIIPNSTTAQWATLPAVVFLNVAPATSAQLSISVTDLFAPCTVSAIPRVLNGYVSQVDADC